MAGDVAGSGGVGPHAPAVYFLSDYGLDDEFVGVVHAVLHRCAPTVPVIDLSHGVPPFDVAAGAALLARAVPHVGSGVVLAVVDPGVGSRRRPVAVEVGAGARGPTWLVGPDNGLLVPAAGALGGAERVVVLDRPDRDPDRAALAGPVPPGPTFDGRDLFAPAAAHLALGHDPADLGRSVGPGTLVRGGAPADGPTGEAGPVLLVPVGWVDRFGNVQLPVARAAATHVLDPPGGRLEVALGPGAGGSAAPATWADDRPPGFGTWTGVRRVGAFGDLGPGQLGLLIDANDRPALVLDRGSAAVHLGVDGPGRWLAVRAAR